MSFWNTFKKIALPLAGAVVGGGVGSNYGDIGRIAGAGLGAAGGSALGGGKLKDVALSGVLGGAGAAALPYISDTLGFNTTGFDFLDNSFGLPGEAPALDAPIPGGNAASWVNPDMGGDALSAGDWSNPDSLSEWNPDQIREAINSSGGATTLPYTVEDLGASQLPSAGGNMPGIENYGGMMEVADPQAALAMGGSGMPPPGFEGIYPGTKPEAPGRLKEMLSSLGIGKEHILPGAGLLYAGYQSSKESPELAALRQQAEQSNQQGAAMQQYLATGTLPPGAQASLDQATAAAEAAVRSKYASMGVAPGSSGERAEISAIKTRAAGQAFQMAAQLADMGMRSANLSGNLYRYLVQAQDKDDDRLAQAVANFASASVPSRRAA